jgi:hypothetical protein
MFVYGTRYRRCEHCGVTLPEQELEASHECDEQTRVAYQVLTFRAELDRLEEWIDAYVSTPRAQKLLDFARYLDGRDYGW